MRTLEHLNYCFSDLYSISWIDLIAHAKILRRLYGQQKLSCTYRGRKAAYIGHIDEQAQYSLFQSITAEGIKEHRRFKPIKIVSTSWKTAQRTVLVRLRCFLIILVYCFYLVEKLKNMFLLIWIHCLATTRISLNTRQKIMMLMVIL